MQQQVQQVWNVNHSGKICPFHRRILPEDTVIFVKSRAFEMCPVDSCPFSWDGSTWNAKMTLKEVNAWKEKEKKRDFSQL